MTPAWLGYFGFKDAPFSKEVADAELWLPSSKSVLVDELCEALSDRASVSLVGEPGVGKTCVLRALRHRLPSAGFRLTYCQNATLGRRDFYRQPVSVKVVVVLLSVNRHLDVRWRAKAHRAEANSGRW